MTHELARPGDRRSRAGRGAAPCPPAAGDGVLARAYEGARLGRRTEGWVAAGTGANAEIAPAIARLAIARATSSATTPTRQRR